MACSHALRDAIGSIILQLQLDSLSEIPVTEFNLIILSWAAVWFPGSRYPGPRAAETSLRSVSKS